MPIDENSNNQQKIEELLIGFNNRSKVYKNLLREYRRVPGDQKPAWLDDKLVHKNELLKQARLEEPELRRQAEQERRQEWQEQERQEQERQEQARQEQARQEQARQEQARQEQARQEQARQEQARQEQARQEQARQEQARQEQARQEQARQRRKGLMGAIDSVVNGWKTAREVINGLKAGSAKERIDKTGTFQSDEYKNMAKRHVDEKFEARNTKNQEFADRVGNFHGKPRQANPSQSPPNSRGRGGRH